MVETTKQSASKNISDCEGNNQGAKTGSDLNKVEVAGLMSMEREPNI